MEQNLRGGSDDAGPANDSIQGRAMQMPDALSMDRRVMRSFAAVFMNSFWGSGEFNANRKFR
ncbi:MAG: hypothetical protein VXX20_00560 [Verrucomicrobiota bacterium]|nr:hypothetical protein [Verrucomicrobiota bacterium]